MNHHNRWPFGNQRNSGWPFDRSHRYIRNHSTLNSDMEDTSEVTQNNSEESSSSIDLGHVTVENQNAARLQQPRIFYNNEETFTPLPSDQANFNKPEFPSLSRQKSQGQKRSKKGLPFHRGRFRGNNRRGQGKDKQYYYNRRQSSAKNIQATCTSKYESDESSENEEDKSSLPVESSKMSEKSPEYGIEYLPNSVNVNKIKNKTDYGETEELSCRGASNLNDADERLDNFRRAKEVFYKTIKHVSPSEIIMDYRRQIDDMSNYCLNQNLRKIEKVLTVIQEQEAYADIFKLHHKNLYLQQQNFDESVSSLKHECSFIHDKNAEDIVKKADNIKMRMENECSLFQKTLPAYAYKKQILDALKNYQVVIISADCSYFFNNVTPIIAASNFSDYSVISCESSSMSCSLVKSDIETIVRHKIENSDVDCMNEEEILNYLNSAEKSSKNCFILNVPLKRSITSDLILASLLDILHQHKESKLILLLSVFDDISKYENYFSDLGVFLLEVPKLLLPVKTVWKKEPLSVMKNYKEDIVCTALSIHILNEEGDVIAFLPCLADAKTALSMFIQKIKELKFDNVECFLLHENNSNVFHLKKQLKSKKRKIFFSTHYAEGIPIPSVRYVIDCGLTRGNIFDNEKKIDVLTTVFSSRSRSHLRKSLVGVYSMGICYRIYNKENFCYDMSSFERPDILTLNPFNSLVTLFHHMPEKALTVQFVDPLNAALKYNTVKQLKNFNALKNGKLTELGKKIVKLPFTGRYSKLIWQGIQWGVAYETVILVAYFFTDSHMFKFTKDEEQQKAIDAAKLELIQNESDPLSFLYIFKCWMENNCNKAWCDKYHIEYDTLNKVKVKVSEICQTVDECLNENIPQEFSEEEDLASSILELLFQCFADNLCVFTGHYRCGYRILKSQQTAFIHPSSILCDKQNMPKLIIFDKISSSSRYFLLGVSSVPKDMVNNSLTEKTLEYDCSNIFDRNLVSQTIEPVGERIIKQVLLGPEGKRLFEIEDFMKKELKTDLIVVDPSVEKGCVNVYALEPVLEEAVKMVNKILKSNLDDIVKAEKSYVLELEKGETVVFLDIKCMKGAKITSVTVKDKLEESASLSSSNKTSIKSTKENISAMKCSINLTWTRRPCNGMCYVSFAPESFMQARKLTNRNISILQSEVYALVSKRNEYELYLSDVPPEARAVDVEEAIKRYLPHSVIANVELKFMKAFETTPKDIAEIKMEIQESCEEYTNLADFEIIVPKPKNTATIMTAYINVFESEDLTEAAEELSNVMIKNFKVSAIPVYRSIIKTNLKIYQALDFRIQEGIDKLKFDLNKIFQGRDLFRFEVDKIVQSNLALIKLLSNNIQVMKVLQKTVNELLEGEILNKNQVNDIHKLFCHGGHMWLRTLEKSKRVFILEEYNSKTIRVYGSRESCFKVKEAILNFLEDTENEAVETVLLSNDKDNRTLMKTLIKEYTVSLEPFVDLCKLRSAELDIKSCRVLLHGSRDSIDRAKAILQHLSSKISSTEDYLLSGGEMCPVCSCPAFNLTIRLQHCGHLYCNECILGLVQQAQFPIQCCAENCSEDIVLDDIIRILEEDDDKIKKLLEASLNEFLERNRSEIFYCPSPDCRMFGYKREAGERWSCPLCHNEICTKCNVVYHYGYTCDVYQGSKKDPDYSFKVWKKGTVQCKECPNCKTAIEKNEGCDHMTCISCKAHFCWVCCREFPSDRAVYNHIPFCDQYPKW